MKIAKSGRIQVGSWFLVLDSLVKSLIRPFHFHEPVDMTTSSLDPEI